MSSSLQLTFSEPLALGAATSSDFEVEPVQGRKVSKVVKTTVVRGERKEKQTGDPSLAADLPSAREDFEKVSVFGDDRVYLYRSFHDTLIYLSYQVSSLCLSFLLPRRL